MKLYVGNLPFSYSEEDLKELFQEYNVSSVKLILDRETGKFRGFGFVEISSKTDALKAIKDLNGKDIDGKSIVVNEARPQEKRNNFSSRRF